MTDRLNRQLQLRRYAADNVTIDSTQFRLPEMEAHPSRLCAALLRSAACSELAAKVRSVAVLPSLSWVGSRSAGAHRFPSWVMQVVLGVLEGPRAK